MRIPVRSGLVQPATSEPARRARRRDHHSLVRYDINDALQVVYSGNGYERDERGMGSSLAFPTWFVAGAMALQVESTGSAQGPGFTGVTTLAAVPEILARPYSSQGARISGC